MNEGFWAIFIVNFAGIVTLILQNWFKTREDERRRRWDKEDRELLGRKLEEDRKHADELHVKMDVALEKQELLGEKMEENTQISKRAFQEANEVNAKIAAILASQREEYQGALHDWLATRGGWTGEKDAIEKEFTKQQDSSREVAEPAVDSGDREQTGRSREAGSRH